MVSRMSDLVAGVMRVMPVGGGGVREEWGGCAGEQGVMRCGTCGVYWCGWMLMVDDAYLTANTHRDTLPYVHALTPQPHPPPTQHTHHPWSQMLPSQYEQHMPPYPRPLSV